MSFLFLAKYYIFSLQIFATLTLYYLMMEKIHNLILIIFVYADTYKVTEEDCLHCRVRLAEVEPRVVPEPGLSTSRSARTEQRGHVRRLSPFLSAADGS